MNTFTVLPNGKVKRAALPGPHNAARSIVATDKWRACEHTNWAFVAAKPLRCPKCEGKR